VVLVTAVQLLALQAKVAAMMHSMVQLATTFHWELAQLLAQANNASAAVSIAFHAAATCNAMTPCQKSVSMEASSHCPKTSKSKPTIKL